MERTIDGGVNADETLQPVLVAADALVGDVRFRLVGSVFQPPAEDVAAVVGIGIAETSIDAVGLVLLLHDVPVHTQSEVGGRGLVGQSRHLVILVVGTADTQFKDRKPLVVQVDAQGSLILTGVAQHQLGRSYEVERQRKATEERYGVFLHTEYLLCL